MRESFWHSTPLPPDDEVRPPAASSQAAPARPDAADQTTAGKQTPAGRNEPPTLSVDPWGHGDHTTIGAAIKAARPGTRILVRSGLYEEGLVIDKPLEIIGQGSLEDVIVRARGRNAVRFRANIGRVSNLTLEQAGGGEFYGVDIAQGRLELEDCDITSATLVVVAVRGGADPRLRRNLIHDGQQSGIYVYEQGLGTFEDNDIFANGYAEIQVSEGGNPTFRRNRIHDGQKGGIYVYKQGLGTFEDNDIFANRLSGISVSEGGNPTVRRNRIHDGQWSGIFVYEQGLGTFEDNDIFANAIGGVVVKEGGNPTVRRNRINRNGYEAVWVYEGGRGTFADNDLSDNVQGAWDVAPECAKHVRRSNNRE